MAYRVLIISRRFFIKSLYPGFPETLCDPNTRAQWVVMSLKKSESCGAFLLAVRLKWLLYFYYNRAEALNLVSSLKNTKWGNNIIKYLRNCLGHVCVGHTYICFFFNSYLPMWAGRLFFRVPSLVTSSCFFIFFSFDTPLESLPLQFREIQVKK